MPLNYPVGKKSLEIDLSLTVSEIFTLLYFPLNPRWAPKVAKIEVFPFSVGHHCTTLWDKNSLEITLSVTVSEIFTIFIFR